MKTNVVLKSTDRNLFGIVIKQNTKNGQTLSVTDLQKSYNTARFQHGWSEKHLPMIMKTQSFLERCYHLLNERGLIKVSFLTFMEMIEREGVVKVLKGLGVWKTSGRAENKSTYCDPYIWVLLAMELNPLIYAKVVIWLTDSLIFNRIEAGINYLPMNSAISKIIERPNYPEYARTINLKIFGRHEKGIRDFANQLELKQISDIENYITQAIDMGMVKNQGHLMKVIELYRLNQ